MASRRRHELVQMGALYGWQRRLGACVHETVLRPSRRVAAPSAEWVVSHRA